MGDLGELFEAAGFRLQIAASERSEAVGLFAARGVLVGEALNPFVFEEPMERAVERAGAKADAAVAQAFGVLEDGVAVAGLGGEAKEDEQDGLAYGRLHIFSLDMSSGDMLRQSVVRVKSNLW
jgi:hypothetical protein